MKKLLFLTLLLATVLPMSSCRRAAERVRRNIAIEQIEQIEWQGMSGAEIVLRVKNNTGYKLQLERATFELFFDKEAVAKVILRDPVEVPRRTTTSVSTQWRMRIADPLALFALVGKVGKGDMSRVTVSYALEGRGGPAGVNIGRKKVPLSEFLSIFGLDIKDLNNFFKA